MELPDKSAGAAPIKKITPVATAKQVQRPATRRFFDFLFAESPRDLMKKVGHEVVVPKLKEGFEQAVGSFLSGILWGGSKPIGMVQGTVVRGGGVNYSGISTQNAMLAARQASVPSQQAGNYQDLVIPTLQMAEAVLANMFELLNQYRVVAVADLYELVSLSPSISDNAYGWTSLDGSKITPVSNGYLLSLPRPTLI